MKFKFVQTSLVMSNYMEEGLVTDFTVIRTLKEYFLGWVWLVNLEKGFSTRIYYVTRYNEVNGVITLGVNKNSDKDVKQNDIRDNVNIIIRNYFSDDVVLYQGDIVYKIEPADEVPEIEPKIRWWKGGKFENLKTYEEFNEATRWYNRDDFITDDDFRKFLIDNNCYDD